MQNNSLRIFRDNAASHKLHTYSGNHRGRGFSSMRVRLPSATLRAQPSLGEQQLSFLLLDPLRLAHLRILCSALCTCCCRQSFLLIALFAVWCSLLCFVTLYPLTAAGDTTVALSMAHPSRRGDGVCSFGAIRLNCTAAPRGFFVRHERGPSRCHSAPSSVRS